MVNGNVGFGKDEMCSYKHTHNGAVHTNEKEGIYRKLHQSRGGKVKEDALSFGKPEVKTFAKSSMTVALYEKQALFRSNFIGPGPKSVDPYKIINLSSAEKEFLRPVDLLDEAAQRHDYAYFKLGADGISGALFNKKTVFADLELANDSWNIIEGYWKNEMDPITGRHISFQTYENAWGVYYAFRPISIMKLYNSH
jgi:hypothetical protein